MGGPSSPTAEASSAFVADIVPAAPFAAGLGLASTSSTSTSAGGCRRRCDALGGVYGQLAALTVLLPSVQVLNTGGGLGWRQQRDERPLIPEIWSALLKSHLAPLGCTIACEPGTYPLASAGLLVAEVNTVEARGGITWLGLDAGQNVNVYAAHYAIPHEIIHVGRPLAPAGLRYDVAGNINEAADVFARDIALPEVSEGDLLALFRPARTARAWRASIACVRWPER